jgi:thiamine-phosphate pyrophosphorylase
MRGLYAIVDLGTLRARAIDPLDFASAVLTAKPAALQLRAKDIAAKETLELLHALRPMCERGGVPLVANDRVDLALTASCAMVHLGQDDLPIEGARAIAPALRTGLSTHTLAQLEAAIASRPTYVAFGPVWGTQSKSDACATVGVRGLESAHAMSRRAGIPLVAIGGITLERAAEVAPHCEAAAVIAALLPPGEYDARAVTARAAALHAAIAGGTA